jgi:hypothetical protein
MLSLNSEHETAFSAQLSSYGVEAYQPYKNIEQM